MGRFMPCLGTLSQVAKVTFVAHSAGDLFGVAVQADNLGLLFVNDDTNAIDVASTR